MTRQRQIPVDGLATLLLVLGALAVFLRSWLHEHPQHNPWAPLNLNDPPGWATARKLVRLRGDPAECRAVLSRSGVPFTPLPPLGEGSCRREDRLVLTADPKRSLSLRPASPQATCAVAAGLAVWMRSSVEPAARELLDSRVVALEHYGTHSCRRIYGGETGPWSEHATGNAIDIAAFVLADGRRISVKRDWAEGGRKAAFLRRVRDGACGSFGTVLSPDYNAAHADHFHLDQAGGRIGWSLCR